MTIAEFLADAQADYEDACQEAHRLGALTLYLTSLQKSEPFLDAMDALQSYATCLLLEERLLNGQKVTYSGRLLRLLTPEERMPGDDFAAFACRVRESWKARCLKLKEAADVLELLSQIAISLQTGDEYGPHIAACLADRAALPELPPGEPHE